MKNVLISGCSWSTGFGLPNEKENTRIWPNQLVNNLWPDATLTNIAVAGLNNESIFLKTANEIIKNNYDCVIVEWSETRRLNFNIGLELYSTNSMLVPGVDINLVNFKKVTGEWLFKNIKMPLEEVLNDHWQILKMVTYINILSTIRKTQGDIFFVNGGGCWDKDYFVRKQNWRDASSYTKNQILQFDYRDDDEIAKLYNKIHDDYDNSGGIQEDKWLNLYGSMHDEKIDTVSTTDMHPGFLSQDKFSKEFTEKINQITRQF